VFIMHVASDFNITPQFFYNIIMNK